MPTFFLIVGLFLFGLFVFNACGTDDTSATTPYKPPTEEQLYPVCLNENMRDFENKFKQEAAYYTSELILHDLHSENGGKGSIWVGKLNDYMSVQGDINRDGQLYSCLVFYDPASYGNVALVRALATIIRTTDQRMERDKSWNMASEMVHSDQETNYEHRIFKSYSMNSRVRVISIVCPQ